MSEARYVSLSPGPTTTLPAPCLAATRRSGAVGGQHRDRVRAAELAERAARGLSAVACPGGAVDQVRDDLGVGLRAETWPSAARCSLKAGSSR